MSLASAFTLPMNSQWRSVTSEFEMYMPPPAAALLASLESNMHLFSATSESSIHIPPAKWFSDNPPLTTTLSKEMVRAPLTQNTLAAAKASTVHVSVQTRLMDLVKDHPPGHHLAT